MAWVEIARFHDPLAASIAQGALVAGGIEAVLLDHALSSALAGAMVPARLVVAATEAEAARALLAAAE